VLGRFQDRFDVLLVAVDAIEGGMASSVLEAAGIPSLLHGPDFDVAELGFASHSRTRGANLLVPKGSRDAARAALVEAWGEERVARKEPRTG
jgi:hypothetical protein